ncbi:MAG: CoA transferase [Burkholderiaceae bacterium]
MSESRAGSPSDVEVKDDAGTGTVYGGLRVLDLSRVLAGPCCGQMFADFGADVIKIEDRSGDENRNWEPVIDGQSANFMSVNRGKRAMTLNLKSEAGQGILRALVARSDVVIDSFLPATAARLGVDDATLRAIRPDLIHVTIGGYGDEGPLRDKPGYDLMLQAFTGMMSITGEPGGDPMRAGASFIDMTTGILAFSGASSALYARQAGRAGGQHVKVSLLETGIALLGYHLVDCAATGRQPERGGSGVWHLVPYQAFRTRDGWLLAGATNDAAWQRLCQAIDAPDLATDSRYASARDRIAHREPLIAALRQIFLLRDTADWMARLDAAHVACSPINDLPTALGHPQVRANQMLVEAEDGRGVRRSLAGVPIKLDATPARPGAAPPYLGEHTVEILRETLGLDDDEIDRLKREEAL